MHCVLCVKLMMLHSCHWLNLTYFFFDELCYFKLNECLPYAIFISFALRNKSWFIKILLSWSAGCAIINLFFSSFMIELVFLFSFHLCDLTNDLLVLFSSFNEIRELQIPNYVIVDFCTAFNFTPSIIFVKWSWVKGILCLFNVHLKMK